MAKQIRQLPIAPDSANPATFNARADAFVKAMQPFADDANALAKELEEFSANVDTKSGDVDTKYADLVQKYNDFIAKYADFFAKYDIFVPAYLDIKTKHGETVSTAKNHKEYIDALKTQIDEALERAKSFINSGNGGIIDDSKTAETSTFSSTEIVRRLNLKADDATAYREWNYKEISDDYTAQNNDALFVNITKPITITLPSGGKIKILDMAGNFSRYNVTAMAGGRKLIFNADYQRSERYFYGGQWRATGGFLLEEIDFYNISAKTLDGPTFINGGTNYAVYGEYLVFAKTSAFTVYDIGGRSILSIAQPLVSGFSLRNTQLVSDGLHLFYQKDNKWKVFKLDIPTKTFVEKNLGSFSSTYNSGSQILGIGGVASAPVFLDRSSEYSYIYMVGSDSVKKDSDPITHGRQKHFVCKNTLIVSKTERTSRSWVTNITTAAKNYIDVGGDKISYDYKKDIIYASNFAKTKLIKINAANASYTEEDMDATAIEKYLRGDFSYTSTCETQTTKGAIAIKDDGVELAYDAYENHKLIKITKKIGSTPINSAAGFRTAKTIKFNNTEIAVVEANNMGIQVIQIEYEKAKIIREI